MPSPVSYEWDLSVLFEDNQQWQAAYDRYESRVSELSFDQSDIDDADSLLAALETRDDLYLLGSRIQHYALGRAWMDVTDDQAQARAHRVGPLNARRDAAFATLERAIREAGREHVEALLAETPALEQYEQYLDDVFRRGAYALDPATEAALSELREPLDAPSRILQTIQDRTFEPPTVTRPDGERRELTKLVYRGALAHPDRAYRREVYERYRDALADHREVVARSYVEHVRSRVARADLRGYDSAFDMEVEGLVPDEFVDILVTGVHNRDPFQRRVEILRSELGIDPLAPWDLRAPLSDATPEIPYGDAVEYVLEAVEPLGDAYRRRLEEFLAEPRVDVAADETKRDVPAMAFGAEGSAAFVYLTYEADLESLYFFAHELGHVMHYLHAREEQPRVHQRLCSQVAEIPSFLHEVLVLDYLRRETGLPSGAVLDAFLRKLPIPAAPRGVEFVRRVEADVRAGDDIGPDRLDAYHRETQSSFHDGVRFREGDGPMWMANNLDRDPYHPYLYLIGSLGALAVNRRLREGELTTDTYLAFLQAGDAEYPMTLLEWLGLDDPDTLVEAAGLEYEQFLKAI